jgi:hypothetical protein
VTSVWLIDAVTSGFRSQVPDSGLQAYRVLLGIACLLKAGENFLHGGWSMVRPGSYNAHRVERMVSPALREVVIKAYQPVLALRLVASVGLILGVVPQLMAAIVAAGLAFELLWLFRYNTVYLALCCTALVFAGHLSGFATTTTVSSANTWSQFLIVLITIDMYWDSAWLKARSEQFRSGLVLAQWVDMAGRVRARIPFGEFWYPDVFIRVLGRYTPATMVFWRATSIGVIAMEALLPVGLLFPTTRPYFVALGILMHVGFTGLLPRKLIPFSVASVASYLLF